MFSTHQFKGTWWLAAETEKKLPGTLTVARGDAELEVLGHFGSIPFPGPGESVQIADWTKPGDPRRIVGLTAEKDHVTLEGAPVGDFPGDLVTYEPVWVLVGKAFADDEEVAFDEMVVQISDLDTWTRSSGFTYARRDSELPEARLGGAFDIRFERPSDIEIPLDGGEVASIEFSVGHSGWKPVPISVTVSQTAFFRLRFAERHSLNALAQRVGQLRNFFCLAVGRPVSVISVTGYQNDHRRPDADHPLPIQLLWGIPRNPDPPTDARHPIKIAFTLPECPNGISDALKVWFGMQDALKPVFNLHFGMRYDPGFYSDARFLAHAQAIESYDRRRRSNKGTLQTRIRAVIDKCPTVGSKIVQAGGFDLDGFATAFEDSRNFYTHYNPRKNAQIARGVLLYVLTVQLQALIEMLLLQELGFSSEAIDEVFKTRVERYREIANAKAQASDEDLFVPQE